MENLDIKHTCPGCNERFKDDFDFAAHISNDHEDDFINEVYWIRKLDYSVYRKVNVMTSGYHD